MATIESVKAKIQGLINKANAATSRADAQLSPAVDALIAGYGSGGGGFVDVTELPDISETEEGVVYRLVQATEASADILVAINDGSSVTTMTLAEMFAAQGASANIPIYIVPELPAVMKPIDEATLTVPFYIVESTGIAYLSLDGTNVNVGTVGDLFEGYDGGWAESSDDITIENTQPGMTAFCVRKEASMETKGLYLAVDGKWQAYKEVIDVEELPVSGVNKHAIYRVGTHVEKDLYKVLAGGEIKRFSEWLIENGYEDNISFNRAEFVDTIPTTHDSTVAYIHNTTGAMYVDNGSGILVPFVSDSLVTILLGNYYGLYDADEVDLGRPGLYAVREGIVIEKYCVNTDGVWREFKSKSIFQEYAAGSLTAIKAEDLLGVSLLADHALANCKSLETAVISSTVATIGDSAFENCENLKEIWFDDNLMGIGNRAFYGCKSITEIDWYSLRNLWDLGSYAFAYCTSLKHAAPTADANGGGYIFNADPTGMFVGCTALETATIDFRPDTGFLGVGGMFEGCTSLHTFTDNVGMDRMPEGMFKGCSSLKDIYVPATKVGWSSWEKGEKWDQGTPDYVIHCSDGDILKSDPESGSDDTPDAPEGGGEEWFNDGKTHLWIEIATEGRMDVPLYFSQTVANGVTIDWGDGSATETTSGTGKRSIMHTYANIGDYVITLDVAEGCAFDFGHSEYSSCVMGRSNGKEEAYRNMLKKVEIGSDITSIASWAFNSCRSLSEVKISNSVTTFGQNVFQYCYSLARIEIPNSVTNLGPGNALQYCYGLSSIVIPDGVTTIAGQTFNSCHTLASVVIPNSVTSIGAEAFYNCYSLTRIVIPNSVTSIAARTFGNCYGMKYYDFTQHTSVPTMTAASFVSISSDCEIRVPMALVDEWKAATNWSTYADKIVGV